MTGARFLAPGMLALLAVTPIVVAISLLAFRARRRDLLEFAHRTAIARLVAGVDPTLRLVAVAAAPLAAALLAVALARPAWNPRPETLRRTGRDVVFLVDVSRSMLAQDLKPSRMGRARFAMLDATGQLEGDRVALVAFAGRAVLRCPLTHDYGFFRMMVESLSPQSVSTGGTRIGDAIRMVMAEVFQDQERRYKDIVLITDGEDHESGPLEAAAEAGRAGIRLVVLGLGSEGQGTRIPITDEAGGSSWLTYEGQPVLTRLDADTLRRMSAATPGGRYFNVATGTVDLAEIYRNVIRTEDRTALESETIVRYDEQFQLFLLPAVLLLGARIALVERRRKT